MPKVEEFCRLYKNKAQDKLLYSKAFFLLALLPIYAANL